MIQRSKEGQPVTLRQVEEISSIMVNDADENDKAFMAQFVGTQMFNQYIEENCEIRYSDEMNEQF